jgi:hypothetical protein
VYATQSRWHKKRGCILNATTRNWSDINIDELQTWMGMLLLMGMHQLPDNVNYWSSDLEFL